MTDSLRLARHLAGLSQQELGRRCGISQPLVSNLGRDHLRPGPELKRKLAAALGVSDSVLFQEGEEED